MILNLKSLTVVNIAGISKAILYIVESVAITTKPYN